MNYKKSLNTLAALKTLAALQKRFLNDILHLKKNDHIASASTNDTLKKYYCTKDIENRLNIYHQNWLFSHIKALAHTYPVIQKLTGHNFFEGMSANYVQANPSSHYSLNAYGERFPEFIKHFAPASTLVYLTDVAGLEWAIHQCRLGISKEILIQSEYPIYRIWQTNQEDYQGDTIVDLNEGPDYLIVTSEFK